MNELFWRIWTAIVLTTLAVLALFVLLATLQFQSINASLTGDRLAVLANRTAEPFLTPARIGLPLSSVRNAAALLERARQTDQEILAVHVFDASGQIVHSTESPTPASIPPSAQDAMHRGDTSRWQLFDGVSFIGGVTIVDGGGELAGGVMIEYPAAGHRTQVRAMAAELGFSALGGLVAFAVAAALLLRLSLRRLFRKFGHIETEIIEFERSAWRSAAGAPPTANAQGEGFGVLRQGLRDAEATYRSLGNKLTSLQPPPGADP